MKIPDDQRIRVLHEKYAPTAEAFELVHTHCVIVCEIAEQLLEGPAGRGIDAELVRAACLLHDIGVYRLYDADGRLDHAGYLRHGVLGHDLLRSEGFPEELCRFCSRHTGVGLSSADVHTQGLPLPVADYLAESPEERLVMYADKYHSKTDPPVFHTADSYAHRVSRFGADKAAAFAELRTYFGDPDLKTLAARHGHALA